MKNNNWYVNEIAISAFLLVVLVFFWNPWYLWMPEQLVYVTVAGLGILVALYAGLVAKEHPTDEREEKLQAQAGRTGFLSGVIAVSVAIAYQAIMNTVDPLLLLVLAVMVLAKLFAFKSRI